MRYLLLLFLAGCASSAPRQYAQGIPVAPSAPAFNPAWDAPITTGQPGYLGPAENLPRSPHGRVLPETPATRQEPGLWAGDQPHAGPVFKVGGVVLQAPQDANDMDYALMRRCALALDAMVEELPSLREAYERLVLGEKMCAVAKVYQLCAEKDLLQAAAAQQNNAVMRLQRVRKAAKDMQKWACEYPRDTEPVAEVVNLFDRLWGSR